MKKLLILPILAIWLLIISWCNSEKASEWDKVTVIYDSFLQNGEIIEESEKVSFVIWMWQTFPFFDTELIWMKKWETKKILATSEEWYKIYHDNNKVQNISNTVFNKIWKKPTTWEIIALWDMKGLILETWPITTKIDFNEPQTREDVEFKIKVLEIEKTK